VTAVDDYRHHRVSREIIFVPVPVEVPAPVEVPEAGSQKIGRIMKPRYPAQPDRPAPWRPAQHPPRRLNKAERVVEFMRRCAEQEQDLREYMKPNAALFKVWRTLGAEAALAGM
jgi:hypothetical protein